MLRRRQPTSTTMTSPSEWEAIAKRQKRAREQVEMENIKLRGMIESQLKIARTLERLLRKRETGMGLEKSRLKKRLAIMESSESDNDVFDHLLINFDHSYADTTTVLSTNGLWTAPRGHRRVHVKHTQPSRSNGNASDAMMHELYVEMTDVTTFPFPMNTTASVAWRCITGGYMQLEHEIYQDLAGQDSVMAIMYAMTLSRRRLQVDFTARSAMKRFVERDKLSTSGNRFLAHRVITSPNGGPGVQVRERGLTIFRSMVPLISYQNDRAKSGEDRQVGLLTNLALDYYDNQLDNAYHAMESLLLDEARNEAAIAQLLPHE